MIKAHLAAAAVAVAVAVGTSSVAAATALAPMEPGFRQTLQCNGGSVLIAVATKRNPLARDATVVTTTLTLGNAKIVTSALRTMDKKGNIYALGYALPKFVKRFPKTLLLPGTPPPAGSVTFYHNISGRKVQKRFEGTTSAFGAGVGTRYVFSDFLDGKKLNTVTYKPGVGITNAAFTGLKADQSDLLCRARGY